MQPPKAPCLLLAAVCIAGLAALDVGADQLRNATQLKALFGGTIRGAIDHAAGNKPPSPHVASHATLTRKTPDGGNLRDQ